MKSSNILGLAAGVLGGEAVADALVDDDNILGHVVVGAVSGTLIGGAAKVVAEETGVSDVLDDLLGF